MHRQHQHHFQPEAGVPGNGQESPGHGAGIGRQLGLQGVQKHVAAQLDPLGRLGGESRRNDAGQSCNFWPRRRHAVAGWTNRLDSRPHSPAESAGIGDGQALTQPALVVEVGSDPSRSPAVWASFGSGFRTCSRHGVLKARA